MTPIRCGVKLVIPVALYIKSVCSGMDYGPTILQPRAYNKNKSGALLFLSPRCKFHHSAHSLLPYNAEWEGIKSVDCAAICILGSKIIVHQICTCFTLLAVSP